LEHSIHPLPSSSSTSINTLKSITNTATTTSTSSLPSLKPLNNKLQSLHTHTGNTVDIQLVTKIKDLEESNRSVLKKYETLQQEYNDMQRNHKSMKEEYAELQMKYDNVSRDLSNMSSSNKEAMNDEILRLRVENETQRSIIKKTVEEKNIELDGMKRELQEKINSSTTVQNLKKMIQQKNEFIKEYRKKITELGGTV
jgi:predicted nuclease with TOPRIM domain